MSAADFPADAIMLDSFHSELRGGTGHSFDWTVARRASEVIPRLILAGGLTPENVPRAIAEVKPYAVDVCSAVETSPGIKDAQLMKAFVRSVRNS
jgi:phosphoribosylanthranilate isomerase